MTLQTLPTLLLYPPRLESTGGVWDFTHNATNSLLDAAGEKFALVFQAPKTGDVAKIGFRTTTVTTGDDVDVRLETVDAAGDPSGTLVNAGSPGSEATQTILDAEDNTWFNVTLDAVGSVTRGTLYAVLVEAPTGYAGQILFAHTKDGNYGSARFPYLDHYDAGAWAHLSYAGPCWRIEYSDGSYGHLRNTCPSETHGETGINSGTDPDEVGLKFQVPFACAISGFWVGVELDGDATFKLYDSGDSLLASYAADKDVRVGAIQSTLRYLFSADVTLTKDSWYRLTMLPGAATSRISHYTVADIAQFAQIGHPPTTQALWTERVDAGAWDDSNTTKRPLLGVLVSQLDDGAGGGGGGSCYVIGA